MKQISFLSFVVICSLAASCVPESHPESQVIIIHEKKPITEPKKVAETPYDVRPVEKF